MVGVWEQDRWSGLGARAILAAHSTDNGATWSTPVVLPFSNCGGGSGVGSTYDRTSDPWISFAGSGIVYASALAFSANAFTAAGLFGNGPSAVLVSKSTDGGSTWSNPVAVWNDANSSGAPTLYFNDRDSLTADPPSGNVYVVWDRLNSTGTGSSPAYLALSKNGGATWTSGILYDPGGTNQAFNNEIAVLPSGTVLDFFTLPTSSNAGSLQFVSLTFGTTGWTPSSPVTVAQITSTGTPNPTSSTTAIRDSRLLAQIAVNPTSGAIAAVWQQQFGSNSFDSIALSVSTNGGSTWTMTPQINGATSVAAFSPTVRYLPNGTLAVTYYDLRSYSAGSTVLSTSAWLTESTDGGKTWHELQLQSPFDLNQAPVTNSTLGFGGPALFLGDNQGLALVGSNPLPFYAGTSSAGAHIDATHGADPLTSSSAHTYTAAALGRPSAAAVATATAKPFQQR